MTRRRRNASPPASRRSQPPAAGGAVDGAGVVAPTGCGATGSTGCAATGCGSAAGAVARGEPLTGRSCASYGRALGTAFQLVDDLLDYEGDAHQLGKNIGDDLREGKATLPLLVALQRATPSEQAMIRQAVETGEEKRLSEIVAIVRRTGALEVTRQAARQEADKARLCLDTLPDSAHRRALLEFCAGSVDRSS